MKENATILEILTSLSKQRGFVFQSSEIYGVLGSTWDYGTLGVELKRNIKNLWWKDMITSRNNVIGMDAAILMHPKVWEASGHVENFHDPLVDNKISKKRYRLDHLLEEQTEEEDAKKRRVQREAKRTGAEVAAGAQVKKSKVKKEVKRQSGDQ